jgi:hypothetical protein
MKHHSHEKREKLKNHKPIHFLGGATLCFIGSSIALHAGDIQALVSVPHVVIDATAYLIHAIGSVPILKTIEILFME